MAADGFVQVPPDSTGKTVDCLSLGAGLVRQRVDIPGSVVVTGLSGTSVAVNVGNAITVNGNVSATIIGTPTIQGNVSATIIGSLPAGTNDIGKVNISAMPAVNISSMPTVTVNAHVINVAPAVNSASRGPVTVPLGSAVATLVAASAGATTAIHVSSIMVTNGGTGLQQVKFFDGANSATAPVNAYLAANGGGFQTKFDPPWRLPGGAALNAKLVTSASAVLACVHFYTA